MSTAGLINRYVWFVTTIYNRGPITLEEMQCRFESHFVSLLLYLCIKV